VYSRPVKEAHYWEEHAHLLGDRDLLGRATWLGITKSGRSSALTTIRNTKELLSTHQKSRAHLVRGHLTGILLMSDYLNDISKTGSDYAGFNLLVGSQDEVFYLNNYDNEVIKVDNGLHGLSNHHLDTPWPKVVKGKEGLKNIMENDDGDIDVLFRLLRDNDTAENKDLPDTGLSKEIDTNLSPLFINMDKYGMRCSTVILIDHENNVTFVERTYSAGEQTGEEKFEFKIEN